MALEGEVRALTDASGVDEHITIDHHRIVRPARCGLRPRKASRRRSDGYIGTARRVARFQPP